MKLQKRYKEIPKDIAEPTDEWKNICHIQRYKDYTSYEIVHTYSSLEEFIEHEKECLESYKDDLREWTEERDMMLENWNSSNADLEETLEEQKNMDEEIERIKKWVTDRNLIFNHK